MYTTVAGCSTQLRGSTGLPPKRGRRRLLGSAAEALMTARLGAGLGGDEAGGGGPEEVEGLSLGGRPRGAGEAADMDPSSYSGLILSTETLSVWVPSWILKYLSPRSRTLYGSSYRGERGHPGAPLRTKTKVEDRSSLGTASGWVQWCCGCRGSKLSRD